MCRIFRVALDAVVVLMILTGEAWAQPPPGFGPSPWPGWGLWGPGPGATVQGDIARGLGYLDLGAGIYNHETALAEATHGEALAHWNQYLYLSQQEANRREYLRMARRQERVRDYQRRRDERLRYHPDERDIRTGDALNVVLGQLTDPQVPRSALRLAIEPIDRNMVRVITFFHAAAGTTICLSRLSAEDGWPMALRGRDCAGPRQVYQEAIGRALQEGGAMTPEALQGVRQALTRLRTQLATVPVQDRLPQAEAASYLQSLDRMAQALESAHVQKVIAELEEVPPTTLGRLLGFMQDYHLRFGPATTPEQGAAYRELYPLLVAHRDRVLKLEVPAGRPVSRATDPRGAGAAGLAPGLYSRGAALRGGGRRAIDPTRPC